MEKILLIDDDVDFVESTKTILESKPYTVVVANNGEEGVSKAKEEKPDLILLDVIMPIKDGFRTAEQIRSTPGLSKVPLVLLTSYSLRRQGTSIPVNRGYDLQADDYIEKPVSPEQLFKVIEKNLKKSN